MCSRPVKSIGGQASGQSRCPVRRVDAHPRSYAQPDRRRPRLKSCYLACRQSPRGNPDLRSHPRRQPGRTPIPPFLTRQSEQDEAWLLTPVPPRAQAAMTIQPLAHKSDRALVNLKRQWGKTVRPKDIIPVETSTHLGIGFPNRLVKKPSPKK